MEICHVASYEVGALALAGLLQDRGVSVATYATDPTGANTVVSPEELAQRRFNLIHFQSVGALYGVAQGRFISEVLDSLTTSGAKLVISVDSLEDPALTLLFQSHFQHTFLLSERSFECFAANSNWSWLPHPVDFSTVPPFTIFEPKAQEVNVLHIPAASLPKETKLITDTVSSLWEKGLRFNFSALQPKNLLDPGWYRPAFTSCDLFIEGVGRYSFGPLAVECISYGKTVLSGNCPEGEHVWPERNFCPIVHTTENNFARKLEAIIREPRSLRDLGKRSRQYAEEHHNADKVIERVLETYNSVAR